MLVPVVLVLVSHQIEIDRKRWVPVGNIGRLGNTGIVRSKILVSGYTVEWDDGRDPKLGLFSQ